MAGTLPIGQYDPAAPGGFSTLLPLPVTSGSVPVDPGVFGNRLRSLNIGLSKKNIPKRFHGVPSLVASGPDANSEEKPIIDEASFEDTALRLKLTYQQLIAKFGSLHDFLNFDSSATTNFELDDKRALYKFTKGEDGYPPHLATIPPEDVTKFGDIFHESYLFYFQLGEMLLGVLPSAIVGDSAPWRIWTTNTLSDLQQINANLIDNKKGIYTEVNVGCREDWYTDEQFAQQHFTGPNPTTITLASDNWIESFKEAAQSQKAKHSKDRSLVSRLDKFLDLIGSASPSSIYVQDYSYFRSAAGIRPSDNFASESTHRFGKRYTGASVVLFQLHEDDGKLHPLAIVTDYKEDDVGKVDGYFTKTKVGIHLVHTHLVEEAVIVAAERSFPNDHIVYQLLNPHWLKTLSLNQAARETLVPKIILNIAGMDKIHLNNYLKSEYFTFHWEDLYIPKDLERRGFPVDKLNDNKYQNYPYAKNMVAMWYSIRKFVKTMLEKVYDEETLVQDDEYVKSWVKEMQDEVYGAGLRSFPTISTLDELIDAVTMCIHIASPQHTAVNYLQEYYQVFVPNKPSCLAHPLPKDFESLQKYKEQDIIKALPLDKANVWLLSAYVPHLLSMLVSEDQSILTYANTELGYRQSQGDAVGVEAATKFLQELQSFEKLFQDNSNAMSVETGPPGVPNYSVMDPRKMAVSILI
ncbi:Lipoxygenase-4 [Dactylellina cionopaga]|nr:Lipoxygenase-4 [Dactylellina cionopaga]